MKANVGGLDRMLRIIIGCALIAMVFFGPQTPWGWIGIIPLATAMMGWCPAYSIFRVSSKKAI